MENETQKRRDQNYNARMNLWNKAKGPKGAMAPAIGCLIFIVIIFGIGVIGAIITEIFK